ncbi:MAG: hypothetical protein FK732_10540 [Asgard group archaeon]|nr:hypothetical protein [Asgard group archaeon]
MDDHHPEKSQLLVEVTAASASSVSWDLDIGTETYTGSNSGLDGLAFIFLLFYPVLFSSFGTWNQTYMDQGLEIMPFFFVDPVAFSDFFYQLANETFISTGFSSAEWVITNMGGTFDNATAVAVFEWHFDMTWTDAGSGHNYAGTYTLIFAFDKTTGAMKGQYIDINYTGQVDFIATVVKVTQRIEEVGYNLPGVGFIPGFEWFMVIPVFALLIGIPVIIRRRK